MLDLINTSRFLSLVLRHKPEKIGIKLDKSGWTDVQELLKRVNQHGIALDADGLRIVVADNSKQRFALSEDGTKIRANQGHTVPVALDLPIKHPPQRLYHGTARQNVSSIQKLGLLPGNPEKAADGKKARHHVHLSADFETAQMVGTRHGVVVVLVVDAEKMAQANHRFYQSENGVWLVDAVPPEYLSEV